MALLPSVASAAPLDGPSASVAVSDAGTAQRDAIVAEALRHRGTPYVWGGASPAGFDCSGFTSYVYSRFGVNMAHSTYAQYDAYERVARKNLLPGDLVFFSGVGHVGLYIGHGKMVHSPRSGKSVEVVKINSSWYARTYVGAARPPLGGQRTA